MLWGTRMVKLGFTRAYATSLQQFISKSTNNRIKAFLAGLGVTTILQSSTATVMICASFASKKMITTAASLAVIIGADIGTTLVAQILTFDLSWLTPMLLVVGYAMHSRYEHKGRKKHIARALIGLGIILLSLTVIKQTAAPLGNAPNLPILLDPLEKEPILALLVSALMTWILHSSLAAVLLIASFTTSGLITLKLGLLLVLGANLGGAIIPYVITQGMNARARRITLGNVIMRITTVLIILPFVDEIAAFASTLDTASEREIVHFHTLFNVFLAALFLPFITPLTAFCKKLLPHEAPKKRPETTPLYLDESALSSPTIALAAAASETLRVAKLVELMFSKTMKALQEDDMKLVESIKKEDDTVDNLYTSIKMYLTRVTEEALDPKESDRFVQILSFATNLEHAGDIIDNSLSDLVTAKIKNKKRFSKEGFQEIKEFHEIILTNMKIAQAIFMSEDPKLARQLIDGKSTVRKAAQQSTERHFQRLRAGNPETELTSALHNDIIRDYKRINSYVTTVAFSILDNAKKHKKVRKPKNADEHHEELMPIDHPDLREKRVDDIPTEDRSVE